LKAGVGDLQTTNKVFGVLLGAKAEAQSTLHIEHSSSISTTRESETEISFSLGDPDDGDEIVVEIFHDPVFGSFVFNTISGRTRCRHEPNTVKSEDPRIRLLSRPSQYIFPTDEMIFDVEIANVGEHVYSYFLLAQDIDSTTSSLEMRMDSGIRLDYEGTDIKLYKEQPIQRQVRVTRGLTGYEYKPVKFALRSACEFAMDYETEPVVETLYNYVRDGENGVPEPRLKWLEPCPAIQWAGELKRDRSFLINSLSKDPGYLHVKIFNPLGGRGTKLKGMKDPNGRVLDVLLRYRKHGEVNWKKAMSEVGGGTKLYEMDFVHESTAENIPTVVEDVFGYIGMDWYIGGGTIVDGTYEIVVEVQCTDVGGPDEFKFYRNDMITGILDRTKPEQYGKALPLKEEILFGEDIVVMFTEDIDCSFPYTFDILVDVEDDEDADTDLKLEKGQLHIICEGRQIRFQVDYTQIDLDLIQGRQFEVYIGKVGVESKSYVADKNGNPLDLITGFIRFEKKFAAIDARRTLTEFVLSKEDPSIDCSNNNNGTIASNELVSNLSALTGFSDPSRLRLSDVQCYQSDSTIHAKVEILPIYEGHRNLKGLSNSNALGSTTLFSKLCNTMNNDDTHSRKLREELQGNISINQVRFVYSSEDLKRYGSTEAQKQEEERLLSAIQEQSDEKETLTGSIIEAINSKNSFEITELQSLGERLKQEKEEQQTNMEELKKELEANSESLAERLKHENDEQQTSNMEELKKELEANSESLGERLKHEMKSSKLTWKN